MGIESGHPQARSLAEAPAKALELVEALLQAFWRECGRNAAEWNVGGGQQGVETPAALRGASGEQHRCVVTTTEFGEAFGLPGVVVASLVPRRFGDWGGDQGLSAAIEHGLRCSGEPGE